MKWGICLLKYVLVNEKMLVKGAILIHKFAIVNNVLWRIVIRKVILVSRSLTK